MGDLCKKFVEWGDFYVFGEMFLVSSNLSGKVLQVVGAPAWTNPQKYRHVKDTCLILAHLYPLPAKLFRINYWKSKLISIKHTKMKLPNNM